GHDLARGVDRLGRVHDLPGRAVVIERADPLRALPRGALVVGHLVADDDLDAEVALRRGARAALPHVDLVAPARRPAVRPEDVLDRLVRVAAAEVHVDVETTAARRALVRVRDLLSRRRRDVEVEIVEVVPQERDADVAAGAALAREALLELRIEALGV